MDLLLIFMVGWLVYPATWTLLILLFNRRGKR